MKKTQVALAALALMASTAALADVAMGGYVEAAVQNSSGSSRMIGGGLDINKLYFAASEDASDGWKAGAFALIRFESTTGGLTRPGTAFDNGTSGNGTFFEIANVNLSNADFGTIEMGRTVDSYWGNGVAGFDVTGGSNLGSAVASVLNVQASKVFIDNSVHYVSPNINGLTFAVTYAMMDSTSGSTIGLTKKEDQSYTANYSAGALSIGVGGMKSDLTRGHFLGIGYDLGVAKVNAVYQKVTDAKSFGVNTAIPLVGALSATAGYYKDSGTDFLVGEGKSTQVGLLYALSKRTRLYANYQKTTGDLTTNLGLSSPNASSPVGTALTFGVGHYF